MLTQEEHNKIVQEVIEKILNRMPEVIGNLMAHHASMNKLKKDFHEKNPEFKNHMPIVSSVIEQLEGKDLTTDYEDILKQAVPEIKKRINTMKDLNFDKVQDFSTLNTTISLDSTNGIL